MNHPSMLELMYTAVNHEDRLPTMKPKSSSNSSKKQDQIIMNKMDGSHPDSLVSMWKRTPSMATGTAYAPRPVGKNVCTVPAVSLVYPPQGLVDYPDDIIDDLVETFLDMPTKKAKTSLSTTLKTLPAAPPRRCSLDTIHAAQEQQQGGLDASIIDPHFDPFQMEEDNNNEEEEDALCYQLPGIVVEQDEDEEEATSRATNTGVCTPPKTDAQWNRRYRELAAYAKHHGHCQVPTKGSSSKKSLVNWIRRQRHQYRLMQEGKKTSMTAERQQALEGIGFVFDAHEDAWKEHFRQLQAFHASNGHCMVPRPYPEQPSLAIWVKCQRRQYQLAMQGKKSSLTADRRRRLEALGFVWQAREALSRASV